MDEGRGALRGLSVFLMGAGIALLLGVAPLTPAAPPREDPEPLGAMRSDPRSSGAPAAAVSAGGADLPDPAPAGTEAVGDRPLRLRIPAIGLDAPVVPTGLIAQEEGGRTLITWEAPGGFAAGWLVTSAVPGQGDNVVLIGHHNIAGMVFKDLHRLRPGHRIQVETRRRVYVYEVVARHLLLEKGQPLEIRQRHLQWILPTGEERLTLVTCWPPTGNTHRLIVVARPLDGDAERGEAVSPHGIEP